MAASYVNVILSSWFLILILSNFSVISHENERSEETVVASEDVEDDIVYSTPTPSGFVYIAESFDDPVAYKTRWILSTAKKEDTDESIAKYNGEWEVEAAVENALKGDLGLILKSKAKHHAISSKLTKAFVFDKKPFIVQYEVNFQNGQECGGAYLKLLSEEKAMNLKNFHDKTPYTIMFGPDKCGTDSKLHFIFRHKHPRNNTITEKHCKPTTEKIEDLFKDKKPHLYTLVIRPDNSYEVLVDGNVVNQGSLLEDFTPPVNPPAEIDDPDDKKPADWDEREKIPDPDAKKPDDWDEDAPRQIPDPDAVKPEDWLEDEPETIPDPAAIKPDDWDDEMDGEWEAPLINNPKCEKVGCGEWKPPLIDNPKYKGKWHAPLIDNPNYKGKWKPRRIPNPDFFEDKNPFAMAAIGAVGIELWSMSDGIYFDNIVITDDKSVAEQWAKETWELKRKKVDKGAFSFWPMVRKLAKNKPAWLWLMYFMYVGIPIITYVRYLQNRVTEEGLITRIVKYTNSHPWLWAIYLVVIGLPLVLAIVFCCSSSEDKQEKKRAAKAKKTDLSTPDDEPARVQGDKSGAGDAEIVEKDDNKIVEDAESDNTKDHSGDEEVENEEEEEEEEEVEENEVADEETGEELRITKEEDVEDSQGRKTESKETEEDRDAEEGSGSEQVSGNSGRSPRRRRIRKD